MTDAAICIESTSVLGSQTPRNVRRRRLSLRLQSYGARARRASLPIAAAPGGRRELERSQASHQPIMIMMSQANGLNSVDCGSSRHISVAAFRALGILWLNQVHSSLSSLLNVYVYFRAPSAT